MKNLSFDEALVHLKAGRRVARAGWNGKRMWLAYMPPVEIPAGVVNGRTRQFITAERLDAMGVLRVGGYVVMWTADGVWLPGWLASQTDLLAQDWEVLEGPMGVDG